MSVRSAKLARNVAIAAILITLPRVASAANIDTLAQVLGSYNLFVDGNLGSAASAYTSDSEGALVVGGNAYLTNFGTATQGTSPSGYSLVVGGALSMTGGGLYNGNTYVGQSAALTNVYSAGNLTVGSALSLTGGTIKGATDVGGTLTTSNASLLGNVYSQGTYTQTAGTVSGNVVVGSSALASNLSLSNGYISGSANVAGNVTVKSATIAGAVAYNGSASVTSGSVGGLSAGTASVPTATSVAATVSSPLDVAGTWSNLVSQSESLGAKSQTAGATVVSQYGGLTLTGTNATLNVFSITSAELSGLNDFTLNAPSGSTVVVDVTGSSVTLRNQGFHIVGTSSSNVLFNFLDASSIFFSGISFDASILAPDATISGSNGNLTGSIVAAALQGSLQLNSGLFSGNVSPVPLPGALIVFASSIAGLGLFGARRKLSGKA
jgi:choice-of-anchor A domain-containing protein